MYSNFENITFWNVPPRNTVRYLPYPFSHMHSERLVSIDNPVFPLRLTDLRMAPRYFEVTTRDGNVLKGFVTQFSGHFESGCDVIIDNLDVYGEERDITIDLNTAGW